MQSRSCHDVGYKLTRAGPRATQPRLLQLALVVVQQSRLFVEYTKSGPNVMGFGKSHNDLRVSVP
jgi:hypothetical protein